MIVGEFAVAAAAHLTTNILSHHAEKLRGTKVGKALAAAKLLKPNFNERLRYSIKNAIQHFFQDHKEYQSQEIANFLAEPYVAREIGDYLLNGDPINIDEIRKLMADALDVPPLSVVWPRGIDATALIRDFIAYLNRSLLSAGDPALSLVASKVNELSAGIEVIQTDVTNLRSDLISIFDKSAQAHQLSEWQEFELQFLSHVSNRFSRLTTPGARDLHGLKQDLSVAYISLNIKAAQKAEPVRAELFLRENPLIIIQGPAGSGKTTLLNYVAWSCGQDSDKAGSWAGGIPFFVPLRTIARLESAAPVVDRLVEYSVDTQNWALQTPKGWINAILRHQKRGILLIDGVDELPPSRRPDFWDWLARFVEEYPETRVVVTSRVLPGKSNPQTEKQRDQWDPPESFVETNLEEMSDIDIKRFIEHWHNAVDRAKLEPFEIADLERAQATLPEKLVDPGNRRIRELCSTPLLCAMVCVLHWREEGYLPRQRVDLYDKCCDMLIEARDLKRQILPASGPLGQLTKNDKERILQRLAFEMMHARPDDDEIKKTTYRIEISRKKAIQWIKPWIKAFVRPEARSSDPDELLDHLIERTGLLREPAGGLVDFPHRTFQEYLAACAAGADGQEDFLANKADDDQWHETIMLAAGTPTGGVRFGHDLVEALLKRAERNKSRRTKSQRIRKTCFALALGCIENLRQPDPEVRDKVLARISEVVPPNDEADAKSLAVAGDAAVPYLEYSKWKDERTATVAACAQTLRLIGSARAAAQLTVGYVEERRDAVVAQACRGTDTPLVKFPLIVDRVRDTGELPAFVDVKDIDLIAGLKGLRRLELGYPLPSNIKAVSQLGQLETVLVQGVPLTELSRVAWPRSIRNIVLHSCEGADYDWLSQFVNLKSLFVESANGAADWISKLATIEELGIGVSDVAPVSHLSKLKSLTLFSEGNIENLSSLTNCKELKQIYMAGGRYSDVAALFRLSSLSLLSLSNSERLKNLEDCDKRSSIKTLHLRHLGLTSLDGVNNLPLEELVLFHNFKLTSVKALGHLDKLTKLVISGCTGVTTIPKLVAEHLAEVSLFRLPVRDLEGISSLPSLLSLRIEGCIKVQSVEFLRRLTGVSSLYLHGMPKVVSIAAISSLKGLKDLCLVNMSSVDDLEPLSGLSNIETLQLSNCPDVESLLPLRNLQRLRRLSIDHCPGLTDASPLAEINGLEELQLDSLDLKRLQIPEALMSKIRERKVVGYRYVFQHFGAFDYMPRAYRRYYRGLLFDPHVGIMEPEVEINPVAV
jgi:Leucine-rich repeat (LRR) protein